MASRISNQYHLIGEYVPMWLVFGLMLFGVVGSVITALLLLAPELSMQMLRPGVIQSNAKEPVSIPTSPVIDSTEIPMASTPENPKAEQIEPVPEALQSELQSQEKELEVKPEISTSASTDIPDQLSTIVSPDTSVEQEASVVDIAPSVEEGKDTRESLSPTPDTATAPTLQAQIESAADQPRDCAPIFTVTFNRSSIRPSELDLNAKATRLGEWLNTHPETIVLIEGYSDSSGPEELNLLISHRRAKVVSELLAGAGIAYKQMATRAFGENVLLAGSPAESGKNRRVSLRVEGADACQESTEDGEVR